ncbi:hypothetical protein GCM10009682_05410 [Luedemannella flava]|uniref:Uncharacterized protein n=1 Tax=Luedemannella flava TaxID=349316 RepID=A0ABN2LG03_9ACTN
MRPHRGLTRFFFATAAPGPYAVPDGGRGAPDAGARPEEPDDPTEARPTEARPAG